MMWNKSISFMVMFLLWTSVSGSIDNAIDDELDELNAVSRKAYKIFGVWGENVKKCWSAGDDKFYPTFVIGNLKSGNISYDSLDEDSFIKAEGKIELYTKKSGPLKYDSLLLDHYIQEENGKIYYGELHVETKTGWATQISHVKLTLIVTKSGDLSLETYVYAGSWGAVSCAHTNCVIFTLVISA